MNRLQFSFIGFVLQNAFLKKTALFHLSFLWTPKIQNLINSFIEFNMRGLSICLNLLLLYW